MTMVNRLFHGIANNHGNTRSHFQYFRISTVKELTDYNGETFLEEIHTAEDYLNSCEFFDEPFYCVFGSFKPDHVQSGMLIGTFTNLFDAIRLVEMLTGDHVQENY